MSKQIVFMTIIFTLTLSLGAAEYRAGNTITVREIDTVHTDIFSGCRNLDVNGFVNGDVYVGCESVTVEGEVFDDIIAGCRILTVTGIIGDNVIGFAETIIIDGEVHGDVLAFAGNVRITERAKIDGNVYVGAGELKIEGGTIGGFLRGGAGDANLNGRVEGKVDLEVRKIYFGPDYFAKGGSTLELHKPLEEYELEFIPKDLEVSVKHKNIFFKTAFFFWSLLALLIVGVVIIGLFKNFSRDYLTFAMTGLGKSIGYGVLILILTPIAIIILAVLILTIPISFILLAAYLVILYLSFAFAALYVGDYVLSLFKKEQNNNGLFLSMLTGVTLVSLITQIPFIGGLFAFIIICFGTGSLVNYIWRLKHN